MPYSLNDGFMLFALSKLCWQKHQQLLLGHMPYARTSVFPKPVTTDDSRPVFDNGRVLANGAKAEKQFKFAGS